MSSDPQRGAAGIAPQDTEDGDTLFDAQTEALRAAARALSKPSDLKPPEPGERPTTLMEPVALKAAAAAPVDPYEPPAWASMHEATRDIRVVSRSAAPEPAIADLEQDAASEVRRSWVITAATGCFAVLVGIIVGMLILKVLARDEAPSLALEHAQQFEQLLREGEDLAEHGRCQDARRRAEAVLLLSPDNDRARRLLERLDAGPCAP